MRVYRYGNVIHIFDGQSFTFQCVEPLERAAQGVGAGNGVLAPMPGVVKAVFVSVGETVEKGARLAILEAMKMEHVLLAARAGAVAEVLCAEGDQVEAGAALVILDAETDA